MGSQTRILVVDDSDDAREAYTLILGADGYDVVALADGERALEEALRERCDAVVLDAFLPGMDGLELLARLRRELGSAAPPIIVCSGFDAMAGPALRGGAVHFLRKPVEADDLRDAVADAVAGRRPRELRVQIQREHAGVIRQHAREVARALVRRAETQAAPSLATLLAVAQAKLDTLAAYVGIPAAAMALVRGDRLEVVAATRAAGLERGFDLGRALPEALEVVETAASLLVADVAVRRFVTLPEALAGARFFAGVPLLVEGDIAVGLVCLFDGVPRRVDGDELAALKLLGRRGSDVLSCFADAGDPALQLRDGRGVVTLDVFEQLLDAELRLLDRQGGSIELAMIEVTDLGSVSTAVARAPAPERLIAGALSSQRVALLKRAPDDSAATQLAAVVDELRAMGAARAVGTVVLSGAEARAPAARELVHLAALALERAVADGGELGHAVSEERVTLR